MKTAKGSILDVWLLVVFIVCAGAFFLIMYTISSNIQGALTDAGFSETSLEMNAYAGSTLAQFNFWLTFISFGIGIASVVSAFLIRTHPIFFIFFFLVQVLLVAVTPIFQDVWDGFITVPELADAVATFGLVSIVIANLPVLTLGITCLVALAMFAVPG